MGERESFQPLTREDKISVVLYRTGIAFSSLIVFVFALSQYLGGEFDRVRDSAMVSAALIITFNLAVGLSVIFIHLYVSRFHTLLKRLYYVALVCLAALLFAGKGDVSSLISEAPHYALLFLPVSGCLGFVTAKEAFCFRLTEGYILALIMPIFLLIMSTGQVPIRDGRTALACIAGLLVLFTLRKIFQPIHYDIGDKSAYQ